MPTKTQIITELMHYFQRQGYEAAIALAKATKRFEGFCAGR